VSTKYELRKVDDHHFIVLKDGIQYYNLRFKTKAWSCDCPARKECKHLAMLPEDVKVKRYPRAEIEAAYDLVAPILFPYRHSIVGSYRRNALDSKDIDIIVLCDEKTFNGIKMLMSGTIGFKYVSGGDGKFTGTLNGIPVDVDRVGDPNHYAAHLLYRTGPASLNIKMRQIAKDKGWTLNEQVCAFEEEDIFRACDMPYISPEKRQ
jgi:DNA polymerase/3'-5' exonuclease PolX